MSNTRYNAVIAVIIVTTQRAGETPVPVIRKFAAIKDGLIEANDYLARIEDQYTNNAKEGDIVTFIKHTDKVVIDTEDLQQYAPVYKVTIRREVTEELSVEIEDAEDEEDARDKAERANDRGDYEREWRMEAVSIDENVTIEDCEELDP